MFTSCPMVRWTASTVVAVRGRGLRQVRDIGRGLGGLLSGQPDQPFHRLLQGGGKRSQRHGLRDVATQLPPADGAFVGAQRLVDPAHQLRELTAAEAALPSFLGDQLAQSS
jgi:hypothetical protein